MRSRWLWIALSIGMISVVWGGWGWLEDRRFQRELKKAETELAGGRYRPARQCLFEMSKWPSGSGEAVQE